LAVVAVAAVFGRETNDAILVKIDHWQIVIKGEIHPRQCFRFERHQADGFRPLHELNMLPERGFAP